jgi:hypothetical protein
MENLAFKAILRFYIARRWNGNAQENAYFLFLLLDGIAISWIYSA